MSEKRKKRSLVAVTLFKDRPQVGGKKLYPLSGGRLAMLEERGNPLVGELSKGSEITSWQVLELLMVARMSRDELVEVAMLPDEEWERGVKIFGIDVEEEDLSDFWEILEAEFEAIRKLMATPAKKKVPRKRARKGC